MGVLLDDLEWEGKILSAFPKAINILNTNGLVISLVSRIGSMSSMSILVPSLFYNKEWPGDPEKLRGRKVFYSRGTIAAADLFVNLNGAIPWSGAVTADLKGFSINNIEAFKEVLVKRGKPGGLLGLLKENEENIFTGRCTRILEHLIIRKTEEDSFLLQGLGALIGLGPGLTPSGDDFLTGIILGEEILSRTNSKYGAMHSLHIDKEEVAEALQKTNPPGRTLLWQALKGHFPAYLLKLAVGVTYTNKRERIENIALEAVRHGETSGTDSAVGFYWFICRTDYLKSS